MFIRFFPTIHVVVLASFCVLKVHMPHVHKFGRICASRVRYDTRIGLILYGPIGNSDPGQESPIHHIAPEKHRIRYEYCATVYYADLMIGSYINMP